MNLEITYAIFGPDGAKIATVSNPLLLGAFAKLAIDATCGPGEQITIQVGE